MADLAADPLLDQIEHIRQPSGSRLCGQACVAMILGVGLDDAVASFGHRKGTKTRALVTALRAGGFRCGGRLAPFRGLPPESFRGLGKVRRGSGNWHWVVVWGGVVYDPLLSEAVTLMAYVRSLPWGQRLTSGLAVSRG